MLRLTSQPLDLLTVNPDQMVARDVRHASPPVVRAALRCADAYAIGTPTTVTRHVAPMHSEVRPADVG